MTTEMGPRDVDLGLLERFSTPWIKAVTWITSLGGDQSYRYNATTATLSISGESDDAGDPFKRGEIVEAIRTVAMLLPIAVLMIAMLPATVLEMFFGDVAAAVFALPVMAVGLHGLINIIAMTRLRDQINVVDHTTEPAPDALDDLQQQYVDGEIDEEQLGERTAEVWER